MRDTLYIVEGPTDLAALLSLGLIGIGRPSCLGQEQMISEFIRLHRFQQVCLVADSDNPGQMGAEKLQTSLRVPSAIFTPCAKDLREFVKAGGTKEIIEAMTRDLLWSQPKKL